jgi:hypothetical protein
LVHLTFRFDSDAGDGFAGLGLFVTPDLQAYVLSGLHELPHFVCHMRELLL